MNRLSVCLYPLNGNFELVESLLQKHFDVLKAQSKPELQALLKRCHIFCIVMCGNIHDEEDLLKIRKLCSAFPKVPRLLYGRATDAEVYLELGKNGVKKLIPYQKQDLLLEELKLLKNQATFRIDLSDFGIDANQCSLWTGKFLTFILKDSNFLKDHTVKEMATLLGISTRHLQREVKLNLGLSPKEILLCFRNFYAAYLLDTNRHFSAKQVAEICGFTNEHRFYKSFSDKTGKSSTQFRGQLHWQDFPTLYIQNIKKNKAK